MRRVPALDRRQAALGGRARDLGEREAGQVGGRRLAFGHRLRLASDGAGDKLARRSRSRRACGRRGPSVPLRRPCRRIGEPGEQAVALDRAGHRPAGGRRGGEAEEAPIIFGVADQHACRACRRRRRRRASPPSAAGRCRRAAARARPRPGRPGPAAARARLAACSATGQHCSVRDQRADRRRRRRTVRAARRRPVAQPIGGAAVAVGAERRIEQRLDGRRIGLRERGDGEQGDVLRQRSAATDAGRPRL